MRASERLFLLRWAQRGYCAGCGEMLSRRFDKKPHHPEAATFDHVELASLGGRKELANGLAKHRRCNERRGESPATGCDRIWHDVVLTRLNLHHSQFRLRTTRPVRGGWGASMESPVSDDARYDHITATGQNVGSLKS